MNYHIKHEIKGRIRFSCNSKGFTPKEADLLAHYLMKTQGIINVKIYERTGDMVVTYKVNRKVLIDVIKNYIFPNEEKGTLKEESHNLEPKLSPNKSGRELNKYYENKLVNRLFVRVFAMIIPKPIGILITCLRSVKYIRNGLRSLRKGKLEVSVLDATAITASILRKDYKTAASVMFLLGIGELLEEWTHKKSVDDLARSMALHVDKVWTKKGEVEVLVPISEIRENDQVIVRMGNIIPVDGIVLNGQAMVNQSSLTGESIGVVKGNNASVYAGTVIEEGEIVIGVKVAAGGTRYEKIVSMIEDSEKLKSMVESRAEHVADFLVPYSFLGTALTYLFTKNIAKALSILMVDFSCALKLSMPIAVLSAMRECSQNNIVVKGGRFLEAVAEADTVVFDKTGTLTKAEPKVAEIITFKNHDRRDMLRLAACLEEHFPHSIANAVVNQAEKEQLFHNEMHTKVEYVVAHGIASSVDNSRVLIGSAHFIFEDEKTTIPKGEEAKLDKLPEQYSYLYMAIGGELAAVICIEDPLRTEAPEIIKQLRRLGIKKVVMLTGDSEKTAKVIAEKVGVDEYRAEVLPEDKAFFVEQEKLLGHKVIMIGDGINDSPALSAADAAIAMSEGAEIAKEIADITISGDNLSSLVALKAISNRLMERIHKNYRFVVSFNTGLILLGITGNITPSTSALLHNVSTLGIGLNSMTSLLKEDM